MSNHKEIEICAFWRTANLVLRHSVLIKIFSFTVFVVRVEWRNLTLHFALLPEQRNENTKYFIPSRGNQTHKRRIYLFIILDGLYTSICKFC